MEKFKNKNIAKKTNGAVINFFPIFQFFIEISDFSNEPFRNFYNSGRNNHCNVQIQNKKKKIISNYILFVISSSFKIIEIIKITKSNFTQNIETYTFNVCESVGTNFIKM